MENTELFNKYKKGKHWFNHTIDYAEKFANFLKRVKFTGILLDAGCGSGRDVKIFADRLPSVKIIGLDYDKNLIAKNKLEISQPNIQFIEGNIEALNFENNSVGACFMINVIHYVNQKKAFSELYRVIKPSGYLFIHFNLTITDNHKIIDYQQNESEIRELVSDFKIVGENKFTRLDLVPKKHTHSILEFVLQK